MLLRLGLFDRVTLLTKLICWDANVAIYLFEGTFGNATQAQLQKIQPIYEAINKGLLDLVLPKTIEREVRMKNSPLARVHFDEFKEGKLSDLRDSKVTKLAAQIRQSTNISTPKFESGSIYIATAILTEANYLQTFDQRMINLTGKDLVGNLVITDDPIKDGLIIL